MNFALVACSAAEPTVAVSAQAIVVATGVPISTPPPVPVSVVAVTPALTTQSAIEAALAVGSAQTYQHVTGTISRDLKLSQFTADYIAPSRLHVRLDDSEFSQVNGVFYLPVGEQWVEAPEWRQTEMQTLVEALFTPAPEIVYAQLLGPMEVDGVATQVYEYNVRSKTATATDLIQQVRLWVRVADHLPIKRETTYEEEGTRVFAIQTIAYERNVVVTALHDSLDRAIAEGRLASAWQKFSSAEGKFTLLLPDIPQETRQTLATSVGSLDWHKFTVELGTGAYMVAYGDYPAGVVEQHEPEDLFSEIQLRVLADLQGVLVAEDNYTVADYPGRAIRLARQEGQELVRMRMVLVGNRLYQIMAVGLPEIITHSTTDQFLDSLQLLTE